MPSSSNARITFVLLFSFCAFALSSAERTIVVKLAPGVDPEEFARSRGLVSLGRVAGLDRYFEFAASPSVRNGEGDPIAAVAEIRHDEVEWSEVQVARRREKRAARIPTDPLYPQQWHHAMAGSQLAWEAGVLGQGVTVAVVDDGLEYDHPDLRNNFCAECSYDFNRNQALPTPASGDDHGTSAIGVAAAGNNTSCGVGVAYMAKVAGLRLISEPVTDAQEARGLTFRTDLNHVFSCSWGPTDDGRRLEGPGTLTKLAMLDAVTNGRGGKGSVFVWAAGNGRRAKDNCNYDGYANSRLTIAVAAVDSHSLQAPYSENCAALMISAPSSGTGPSIVTTDLKGSRGTSNQDCTASFGGTSAAAPLAAGVVALMLSANPNLTWRDVMHVLVRTSSRVSPADPSWATNGGGFAHSHKFGFGLVNASAAVEMSRRWQTVAPLEKFSTGPIPVRQDVRELSDVPTRSATIVTAGLIVEYAEVVFTATTRRRGDISVQLVSPYDTVSQLAEEHDDANANYDHWTFTSCRHWGENSMGMWELRVKDMKAANSVNFQSWELTLYGTAAPK